MATPLLAPETAPVRNQRRLRRLFAPVTCRLDQRDGLRRRAMDAAPPLLMIALIAGAGMAAAVLTSPWPLGLTLRHLAAGPRCPLARAVGLAPARHGEPGYWAWHDLDLDGWSCGSLPGGVGHGLWVLRWW